MKLPIYTLKIKIVPLTQLKIINILIKRIKTNLKQAYKLEYKTKSQIKINNHTHMTRNKIPNINKMSMK